MKQQLTIKENRELVKLCQLYKLDFKVPWGKLDICWDDELTLENGILGKFFPPNEISLPMWYKDQNDGNFNGLSDCQDFKDIVAILGHEIYHCYQYNKCCDIFGHLLGTFIYLLWGCRIWAELTIERGAEKETKRVAEIIGQTSIIFDED